ncbi:MAG: DoxX family protein [Alphaproteobacteria bacterium]|nr:DoxX family protein [Alphaproteobacteria bacterium]
MSRAAGIDNCVLLVGRVAMAVLFLPSGIEKFLHYPAFVASLAGKGLPFPELWAPFAVATEAGGGLLLLLGVELRWVALLMVVFVILATATTHRFWEFEGAARRGQAVNFYKNIAIIGGLLFLRVSGAGRWSWDGWRRG